MAKLHRVIEKQEQGLIHLGEVGADLGKGLDDVLLDAHRLVANRVLDAEYGFLDDFAKIDVRDLNGKLALLDSPEASERLAEIQSRLFEIRSKMELPHNVVRIEH